MNDMLLPSRFDRRRRAWLEAALLVLLPALWWWPLLAGRLPDFMDTIALLYPMRIEAARQIRDGVLPLWSPALFCGTPLAANPQVAVWYPPHLLLWLWPAPLAYGLLFVAHIIWGGLGMRALVRRWTPAPRAALLAAVGFQFGSLLVARVALPPHLESTPWIPWIMWAADRAAAPPAAGRRWRPGRATVWLALFGAAMFLAGAPQVCFYAALLLPVWLVLRAAPRPRRIAGALVQGIWAAGLAALLVGIQLLPTLELLRHVERGAIDIEKLRGQGLAGAMLWRALLGGTGTPLEDTDTINAIGAGLLLLVPLTLLRRRHRWHALGLLAVLALGLALAASALVPWWARVLPLYQTFHAPRRALLVWSCVGPAAAGLGAGVLAVWWRRRRWSRAGLGLLLAALLLPNLLLLPRLERVFCRPDHLRPDPRVVAAIGGDRFLALDPGLNYSFDSRRADYGRSLMPNVACFAGLRDAQGYDPLVLTRYGRVRNLACGRSGVFYPSHGVFLTDPASPVLRLLAVRWLVGRWDLFDPGRVIAGAGFDRQRLAGLLRLELDDPRWPLWRFTEARPEAWVARRVVPAPDAAAALRAAASQPDPYQTAFVEEPLDLPAVPGAAPQVRVERPDARTIRLQLESPASQPVLVCLAENWMPGWQARSSAPGSVGPAAAEVLPANGFQLAAVLPAGADGVEFRYAPVSFWRGAGLSLAGLLLCLAAWWAERQPPAVRI